MPSRRVHAQAVCRVALVLIAVLCREALGSALVVPDQAATIQAAVDAHVDSVLIRPGEYSESPIVSVPVFLSAANGPGDRPTLAGLTIRPDVDFDTGDYRFARLQFSSPIRIDNSSVRCGIRFDDCNLAGGVIDTSGSGRPTESVEFHRSTLTGNSRLIVEYGHCVVESCKVIGTISLYGDYPQLKVRGCTFEGNGTGAAIGVGVELEACLIEGNTIRKYGVGLGFDASAGEVSNNVIEDCSSDGMRVRGGALSIVGNVIRRCGSRGIDWYAEGGRIEGNLVDGCSSHGIDVATSSIELEVVRNVVSNNDGHGIEIFSESYSPVRVIQNTACFNGRSGIAFVNSNPLNGTAQIERNIGYGNGGYGLDWLPANTATVGCNDWFGNGIENVRGLAPSSDDFSVDPGFCDSQNGDFRLRADSPLADRVGCGLVGALGIGCGLTATVLHRFDARRVSEGVHWQVGEGATASVVWLERSEVDHSSDWIRPITERSLDGRGVTELDRSAIAERAYWYRLVGLESHGLVVLGTPVRIEPAVERRFALLAVGPSPGSGPVRVGFALAHDAAIDVEVFDVQGRVIASVARGVWPAGQHLAEWYGLTRSGAAAPAGWYVIRYRHPGGEDRRRILRSR